MGKVKARNTHVNILWYHSRMNVGGVMNSIWLAERLVKKGHHVVFLAEEGPLSAELAPRGIQFRPIEYARHKHPSIGSIKLVMKAIRKVKADITWTMHVPCAFELYFAAVMTGIPVYPLYGMPLIPKYRMPISGNVGVVLPRLKDYFVKLGMSPDNITVIHGRLNGDEFRPMSERPRFLRKKFNIPEGNRIIVLISRIHRGKWGSILLFANAANHLAKIRSDVTCVVVGGGEKFGELQQLSEEGNSGRYFPSIILTDMVVGNIPEIMNEADIVIGMGSTCPLAMLCGRPVIAIGNNGYSDVVSPETISQIIQWHFNLHYEGPEQQPEFLVTQITDLLEDESRRSQLSSFGRRLGLQNFDISIGANLLERAFIQEAEIGSVYTNSAARILDLFKAYISLSGYRVKRRLRQS